MHGIFLIRLLLCKSESKYSYFFILISEIALYGNTCGSMSLLIEFYMQVFGTFWRQIIFSFFSMKSTFSTSCCVSCGDTSGATWHVRATPAHRSKLNWLADRLQLCRCHPRPVFLLHGRWTCSRYENSPPANAPLRGDELEIATTDLEFIAV